jgi:hypothetical protein
VYCGTIITSYLRKIFDSREGIWGQYLWSKGYFCTTVGNITEEMIKEYIENQEATVKDSFKIAVFTFYLRSPDFLLPSFVSLDILGIIINESAAVKAKILWVHSGVGNQTQIPIYTE